MALVTDQSSLFNFVILVPYRGQYSGSQGIQDFASSFAGPTTAYVSTIQTSELNSTALVTTGFNTYYKLQGFNASTGKYEVWYSKEKPLLTPPSGNILSNIEIVLTWVDR
jgi:hypothetical protein